MGWVISAADKEVLKIAVEILSNGGVIIFPTETVYGIGADILNSSAVERVGKIKRRSLPQPLLIHCGSLSQVIPLVKEIPKWVIPLINKFWPGPLALIFFRSEVVPTGVTAGRESVGIRMVNNPIFIAITKELGRPLVGSSANIHNHPPTNRFSEIAPEVINEVDLAIDAGTFGSGKPSTILDVTSYPPRLLRAGDISKEEIEFVFNSDIPI